MATRADQPNHHLLTRIGGVAGLAAALCLMQGPVLHPEDPASPLWVPNHFAYYVGYVLAQLALLALLVDRSRALGTLGSVGVLVAFLGAGFTAMEGRDHTFSLPLLQAAGLQGDNPDELHGLWELILNATLFSLGHLLLGIAAFRRHAVPRLAALGLAIGAPLLAFSPPIGIMAVALTGCTLYAVGIWGIGLTLLRPLHGSAPVGSRVRPGPASMPA